jgi:hypothetical protein
MEDETKRIYDIDGQQLMHNLLSGEWFILDESELE